MALLYCFPEIHLRLSTPHVHAGVAAACPCGRTLRSWSDVFPCGTAVRGRWTGVFVLVVPALWPRVWWPSPFRPSWQVDVAVIVCILIDWVISPLPRGRFERWSWQIHVVDLISQLPHLQYLTTKVFLIAPAKRVENQGSPWLVSVYSAPLHALLPQWCIPVRWLRMGTSTYW